MSSVARQASLSVWSRAEFYPRNRRRVGTGRYNPLHTTSALPLRHMCASHASSEVAQRVPRVNAHTVRVCERLGHDNERVRTALHCFYGRPDILSVSYFKSDDFKP